MLGKVFLFVSVNLSVNGRYLLIDIQIGERILTCVNVYAPNNDQPEFFHKLVVEMQKHENQEIVIGGNFNLVLDENIDSAQAQYKNNTESAEFVNNTMNELSLVDVWREQNTNVREYTWARSKPKYIASRLDFFLVNYGIMANCTAQILPGFATDHSLITLCFQINNLKCGKGVWKFNTSLLSDIKFLEATNNIINQKRAGMFNESPAQRWQDLSQEIINHSKQWSVTKVQRFKNELQKIITSIQKHEDKMLKEKDQSNINQY